MSSILRGDTADQVGFVIGDEGGQDGQSHARAHPGEQPGSGIIFHHHRILEPILPEPRLIGFPDDTPPPPMNGMRRKLLPCVRNAVPVGIVAAAIDGPRIVGDAPPTSPAPVGCLLLRIAMSAAPAARSRGSSDVSRWI